MMKASRCYLLCLYSSASFKCVYSFADQMSFLSGVISAVGVRGLLTVFSLWSGIVSRCRNCSCTLQRYPLTVSRYMMSASAQTLSSPKGTLFPISTLVKCRNICFHKRSHRLICPGLRPWPKSIRCGDRSGASPQSSCRAVISFTTGAHSWK